MISAANGPNEDYCRLCAVSHLISRNGVSKSKWTALYLASRGGGFADDREMGRLERADSLLTVRREGNWASPRVRRPVDPVGSDRLLTSASGQQSKGSECAAPTLKRLPSEEFAEPCRMRRPRSRLDRLPERRRPVRCSVLPLVVASIRGASTCIEDPLRGPVLNIDDRSALHPVSGVISGKSSPAFFAFTGGQLEPSRRTLGSKPDISVISPAACPHERKTLRTAHRVAQKQSGSPSSSRLTNRVFTASTRRHNPQTDLTQPDRRPNEDPGDRSRRTSGAALAKRQTVPSHGGRRALSLCAEQPVGRAGPGIRTF